MIKHFENIRGEQKKGEKICSFFASDYHFEMISIPYIEKELKDKSNVVILTENDLNNSIKKVLSSTNLDENKKQEIFDINWSNNNENKLEEINKKLENNNGLTVFIKGGKKYIEEMDSYVQKHLGFENIRTIHCYPIDEIKGNMQDIVSGYDTVLSTIGKTSI